MSNDQNAPSLPKTHTFAPPIGDAIIADTIDVAPLVTLADGLIRAIDTFNECLELTGDDPSGPIQTLHGSMEVARIQLEGELKKVGMSPEEPRAFTWRREAGLRRVETLQMLSWALRQVSADLDRLRGTPAPPRSRVDSVPKLKLAVARLREAMADDAAAQAPGESEESSVIQADLARRFSALRDRFCVASDRWPNLQSILITGPEDGAQPLDAHIPAELAPHYDVPLAANKELILFKGTLIGGASSDKPAYRFRAGLAGMLILRRSFGRFSGDPRWIEDPDEHTACGDRLRALSEAGARELEQVGRALGLSANTLGWKGLTKWRLAVHETVEPKEVELTDCRSCEVLQDFFLASAQAIDTWMLKYQGEHLPGEPRLSEAERRIAPETPLRAALSGPHVSVDHGHSRIIVDGESYAAELPWCSIVQCLIDADGEYRTGPTMQELKGCRGKKIWKVIQKLEAAIPAIRSYLKHEGNKGYRLLNG